MRKMPAAGVCSVAVADWVAGPLQPARVLGAFRSAVHLQLAGESGPPQVVALVTNEGVALPNAVLVSSPDGVASLASLHDGEASVGAGEVTVGALRVVARRWWNPRPQLPATSTEALAAAFHELTGRHPVGPDEAGLDVAPRVAVLEEAVHRGDPDACVEAAGALIGLGSGLTPAGDDVVAGLLAGLRLLPTAVGEDGGRSAALADRLEAAVVPTAHLRTPALSAALLAHAGRGEVARPVARLLRALTGRGDSEAAARRLANVGHTSGRDLLTGLHIAAAVVCAPPLSEGIRYDPSS
ncbi:MAG: DUF2877 domain-containing protein [Egibacteraceae bacterium]